MHFSKNMPTLKYIQVMLILIHNSALLPCGLGTLTSLQVFELMKHKKNYMCGCKFSATTWQQLGNDIYMMYFLLVIRKFYRSCYMLSKRFHLVSLGHTGTHHA